MVRIGVTWCLIFLSLSVYGINGQLASILGGIGGLVKLPPPFDNTKEYLSVLGGEGKKTEGGKPDAESSKAAPGSKAIAGPFGEDQKKGGGISGFLGIEEILNPIIELRRTFPGEPKKEPDCVRTYFMGPYSKPITFSANGTVGSREDLTCKWNFIGSEPCIPSLTCTEFNLLDKCLDYLEVYDGHLGFEKYCEKKAPLNVSAEGGLRDLYVKYKAFKPESGDKLKFTCSVSCSSRGEGKSLPKAFEPKTNNLCQCGKRPIHDRIVNGENSKKHEFPWIAALVKARTRQPFCGASIVNDRTVLTAAHCFKGDFLQVANLEIVLGGHLMDSTPNFAAIEKSERPLPKTYDFKILSELDTQNGSARYTIEEVVIHPLYVTETNDFDVAVIKLASPIDFAKLPQLNPVCFPTLGSYLRTFAKRTAIVAGWGLGGAEAKGTPEQLQKLNVTIYTPKDCKETYAHRVSRRMLCAGYVEGGKDSCMGDSGGPLVLEESPQIWHQIGTVSWGDGCAQSKSPGAYIRVTEIAQWVHYHSNMNGAVWCESAIKKNA